MLLGSLGQDICAHAWEDARLQMRAPATNPDKVDFLLVDAVMAFFLNVRVGGWLRPEVIGAHKP